MELAERFVVCVRALRDVAFRVLRLHSVAASLGV